jgi:hypothetical protein
MAMCRLYTLLQGETEAKHIPARHAGRHLQSVARTGKMMIWLSNLPKA